MQLIFPSRVLEVLLTRSTSAAAGDQREEEEQQLSVSVCFCWFVEELDGDVLPPFVCLESLKP